PEGDGRRADGPGGEAAHPGRQDPRDHFDRPDDPRVLPVHRVHRLLRGPHRRGGGAEGWVTTHPASTAISHPAEVTRPPALIPGRRAIRSLPWRRTSENRTTTTTARTTPTPRTAA